MASRNATAVLSSHASALRKQRIKADTEFYNALDYDRSLYTEEVASAARMFLIALRSSLVCTPEEAAASAASSEATANGGASEHRAAQSGRGGSATSGAAASRGTKRPAAGSRNGKPASKKSKTKEAGGVSDTSNGNAPPAGRGGGGNTSIPPGSEVACRVKEDGHATWILAKVRRYVSESKKYDVTDSGDEDGLKTHMVFKKHIRVLPKKAAEFEAGTRVYAVYPDTTTYYAAVVKGRRGSSCVLVFDDEDEDEVGVAKEVNARHVFVL